MNNKMLVIGVVLVVVLVAAVVYLTRGSTEAPSSTKAQPVATPVEQKEEATSDAMMEKGAVKEFSVTGSPFKMVPDSLTVKKGDTVKITFKNTQGIHDFTLDEFDVKTKQLQAGEEEVVQFVADKVGTYEFYCSVGNHRAQGMEGTLTVE